MQLYYMILENTSLLSNIIRYPFHKIILLHLAYHPNMGFLNLYIKLIKIKVWNICKIISLL